jgi:hypothetical protein
VLSLMRLRGYLSRALRPSGLCTDARNEGFPRTVAPATRILPTPLPMYSSTATAMARTSTPSALLQAVGIAAYPVLISSKFRIDPSFTERVRPRHHGGSSRGRFSFPRHHTAGRYPTPFSPTHSLTLPTRSPPTHWISPRRTPANRTSRWWPNSRPTGTRSDGSNSVKVTWQRRTGFLKLRGNSTNPPPWASILWRFAKNFTSLPKLRSSRRRPSHVCIPRPFLTPDRPISDHLNDEVPRLSPLLKPTPAPSFFGTRSTQGQVALVDMRSMGIALPFQPRAESSNATFIISFTNGDKLAKVIFVSGSEELRKATVALARAKYFQSFPDNTPAQIIRRATLNCSVYSRQCTLMIATLAEAAAPIPNWTPIPVHVVSRPGPKANSDRR